MYSKNLFRRLNKFKNFTHYAPDLSPGIGKYLYYVSDHSGCGYYRCHWPADLLAARKMAIVNSSYMPILNEGYYRGLDCVVFQRKVFDNDVRWISEIKKIQSNLLIRFGKAFKMIFDVDDIIAPANSIPDYNVGKKPYDNPQILENLKIILHHFMDEMVVCSEYMRQHYQKYTDYKKITVIPDFLRVENFAGLYDEQNVMENFRKNKKKMRILYTGAMNHFDVEGKTNGADDFYNIIKIIRNTVNKYQWVFLGGYPPLLTDLVKSRKIEHHEFVDIYRFPKKIKELNCQLAIAPLADSPFNRAKANIKLTECGALGLLLLAQNMEPYEDAQFKFDSSNFLKTVERVNGMTDKEYLQHIRKSKKYADQYLLDDNLSVYPLVNSTHYGDPSRLQNSTYAKFNS